jgi:metallothiol transferase
MTVAGFNHVTIKVANLERSLRFYHELLQMQFVHRGKKDVYLTWGNAWICLIEVQAEQTCSGYGVDHVAFTCDEENFDRFVEILLEANVVVVRGPLVRGGGHSVNFLDPDGTQIELHTSSLAERMRNWA